MGEFPLFVYKDSEVMTDIKTHIRDIVESGDIFIEDIAVPENGGTLRVVCDTESGISSDQLVGISKKILNDTLYDTEYAERFDLEVTSPGITTPLKLPRHFRKNRGREVELFHKMEQIKNPLRGVVKDVSNDTLTLDVRIAKKQNEIMHIPFGQVEYAVIKLKW